MGIKLTLLIVFFVVMVAVGLYSRKHARSVDGFVLGGRSVGPWLTAFAYGTSYFSAVVFVGYAGQFGWKYGLASTWIGIGNAVLGSLLAWVVLGRRTKVMSQHLKSKTCQTSLAKDMGARRLKLWRLPSYSCSWCLTRHLSITGFPDYLRWPLTIPYTYCVVVMAVFTGIYVILGGYMATAINDFIQGIIMLIGIVAVIAPCLAGRGASLRR